MNKLSEKWIKVLKMTSINEIHWDKVSQYCGKFYEQEANIASINTLVTSLKILSKIDLNKVIFVNIDGICEKETISIHMTPDQIYDIKMQTGVDVLLMTENVFIEEIIQYLNSIIERSGGVVIYSLHNGLEIVDNKIEFDLYILPLDIYRKRKINKLIKLIDDKN